MTTGRTDRPSEATGPPRARREGGDPRATSRRQAHARSAVNREFAFTAHLPKRGVQAVSRRAAPRIPQSGSGGNRGQQALNLPIHVDAWCAHSRRLAQQLTGMSKKNRESRHATGNWMPARLGVSRRRRDLPGHRRQGSRAQVPRSEKVGKANPHPPPLAVSSSRSPRRRGELRKPSGSTGGWAERSPRQSGHVRPIP